MKILSLVFLFFVLISNCSQPIASKAISYDAPKPVEGLTLVAPRDPFKTDPMTEIKSLGAGWIAVVPYGFSRPGEAKVYFDNKEQWWGEGKEGCEETVKLAHEAGLKVMLKPQVWIPQGWTGDMDFQTDSEWEAWESGYEEYLLTIASVAEGKGVELLCIGTEFKISVQKRPEFWQSLIKKLRVKFSGKLVYAANWDEYQLITFWDELDYIGINAYFPLINDETPAVTKLRKAWKPIIKEMESIQAKFDRPVLFTEFGYLSTDGCAYNTWELEKNMRTFNINEQAQANAYDALFKTFWQKEWWHGGFVWKWFPETPRENSRRYRDYTPQGKLGATMLSEWYGQQ